MQKQRSLLHPQVCNISVFIHQTLNQQKQKNQKPNLKSGHLIYELCHLDQVKQIEKQFLKQDIEESLGTFTNWEILGGGDSPLLILHYTEGSYCEEEKRKKETTVYYQCLPRNQLNNPKSTETSIISFQKVNSCDYLGIVHVQEFCKNSFDHQNPPVVTGFQCIQMTDE
ncbi:os-9-related [Anaeramoeba flamelloides]|uniref:Os-9-related n=1 Tax=Anaeramoeba flamelloides TaxID=1746091 RepID=A0AAV7Y942_9EUKA|nr:os-9-related [Anaeramoeba flamelloides]